MDKYLILAGRLMLAQIFLIAGIGKISGYAATQSHMIAMGVPGSLLPLVIALEIFGGLALVLGWQIRWTAFALALFCVASALIFHNDFANVMQKINFMKNIAMAGGFLILAASGPGPISLNRK